jgi:tetratricopeptide (TPR) repeat protein
VREYQLAIAGRPGYDEAHYNLAVALASRGSMEEAEKTLEGAIRYAPDYFEAHLKLGQILAARGASLSVVPHLRKAAQSPDAQVRKSSDGCLEVIDTSPIVRQQLPKVQSHP